jgi:hypothetical protein
MKTFSEIPTLSSSRVAGVSVAGARGRNQPGKRSLRSGGTPIPASGFEVLL